MRRTQNEIEKVRKDIDRLNSENAELGQQVKALKTDPHLIEKIAREELQHAKPGEVIIRIPQSQQPPAESAAKP
jgi:cell division protein FtsB